MKKEIKLTIKERLEDERDMREMDFQDRVFPDNASSVINHMRQMGKELLKLEEIVRKIEKEVFGEEGITEMKEKEETFEEKEEKEKSEAQALKIYNKLKKRRKNRK